MREANLLFACPVRELMGLSKTSIANEMREEHRAEYFWRLSRGKRRALFSIMKAIARALGFGNPCVTNPLQR